MSLVFSKDRSGRAYGVLLDGRILGSIANYGDIVHGDIWVVRCEGMTHTQGSFEDCQQALRGFVRNQVKESAQVVTVKAFGQVTRSCPSGVAFVSYSGDKATQNVLVTSEGVDTWVNNVPRAFTAGLRKGDQVELFLDLARVCLRPLSVTDDVVAA